MSSLVGPATQFRWLDAGPPRSASGSGTLVLPREATSAPACGSLSQRCAPRHAFLCGNRCGRMAARCLRLSSSMGEPCTGLPQDLLGPTIARRWSAALQPSRVDTGLRSAGDLRHTAAAPHPTCLHTRSRRNVLGEVQEARVEHRLPGTRRRRAVTSVRACVGPKDAISGLRTDQADDQMPHVRCAGAATARPHERRSDRELLQLHCVRARVDAIGGIE